MGSQRLPGKSLLPLAGKPMLWRIIERVKRCETLDEVILATTMKPEDHILCQIAEELGIGWYSGSENDLVSRIYACAKITEADVIVRICSDNPFIEPSEVDRIVNYSIANADVDKLFTNTQPINNNGYPDGIGAEVYTINQLEFMTCDLESPEHREHPHKFFYENNLVETCHCPIEHSFPDVKIDVNTQSDYDFAKMVFDGFGHNNFAYKDYVEKLRA